MLTKRLRHAARTGDVRRVEELVRTQGADVNSADDDGTTALHMAAQHGHVEAVQALMDANEEFEETPRVARRGGPDGYMIILFR